MKSTLITANISITLKEIISNTVLTAFCSMKFEDIPIKYPEISRLFIHPSVSIKQSLCFKQVRYVKMHPIRTPIRDNFISIPPHDGPSLKAAKLGK
jgi:hypothetical protein